MEFFIHQSLARGCTEDALQIASLRAALAQSAIHDVWRWSDQEVLEAVACRHRSPLPMVVPPPALSLAELVAQLAAASAAESAASESSALPSVAEKISSVVSAVQGAANQAKTELANAAQLPPLPVPTRVPQPNWVEIELVDKDGYPLAYEEYVIELSNGKVLEGQLDSAGRIRVDDRDFTFALVSFPKLKWQVV